MKCICYRKGYKYQLYEDYENQIPVYPDNDIITDYIELSSKGNLRIKTGYAWDGPSGPTIDTLNFMRGALVHDALYQLMRESKLPPENKEHVDQLLKQTCRKDRMSKFRSWYIYHAVKRFGKPSMDPKNKRKYIGAPKGCKCNRS